MASAMVALATKTLGSSASSITFGSIPATYRDLRLVMTLARTTGTDDTLVQINGDTGANYYRVNMYGTGSSTGSGSSTDTGAVAVNYGDTSTQMITLDLLDYSATDKHKSGLVRSSSGSLVLAYAVRWASTSAITTLAVSVRGASLASGSVLSLYGIASA